MCEERGGARCFALVEDGCEVLVERRCAGCVFYKTGEQIAAERRRSARRLEALGLGSRAALKYGGYGI